MHKIFGDDIENNSGDFNGERLSLLNSASTASESCSSSVIKNRRGACQMTHQQASPAPPLFGHRHRKGGAHRSSDEQERELEELIRKASLPPSPPSSSEDDESNTWKKYAKIILPHVGLSVLSCIYVVIGALVFYNLELPNEMATRSKSLEIINEQKSKLLERLWDATHGEQLMSEEEFFYSAYEEIDNITRILFNAFEKNFVTAEVVNKNTTDVQIWSFYAAIFFSATVLATIGYGNIVPVTFGGRMFCICYGLFGVPLILITIADLGKFLSEHLVWLYSRYCLLKNRLWRLVARKRKRQHRNRGYQMANSNDVIENDAIGVGVDSLPTTANQSLSDDEVEEEDEFVMYDYVSIPITWILLILTGYTALGGYLFSQFEGWSFFEGFYFSFITVTTVGFGDLVPENERYYLFNLLYIILGLALTTMAIDLVGIQYIRKIHFFGRAIQDARYALVNVGGKMIHVGDLMKYAQFLHKKYSCVKAPHVIVNPLARLFPNAYIPKEIDYISFIDFAKRSSVETLQSISYHHNVNIMHHSSRIDYID